MIKRIFNGLKTAAMIGAGTFFAHGAMAQVVGAPEPGNIGLQPAYSPVAERMASFHDMLLWIITIITLFVLGLLVYVVFRFRESANPTPSRTTHNTLLEVAWTAVPVLILVIIAVPSFQLLYYSDRTTEADMTLKATGYQWYWGYDYQDHGFQFDAFMIPDEEIQEGQHRLLETDERVIVPVNAKVRLLTTAADVLHAFAVPSLGVKMDAVPGQVNETWFQATEVGVYYGQCSELCGTGHGFMPIAIEVVSQEDFDAWVTQAQARWGGGDATVDVAAAR